MALSKPDIVSPEIDTLFKKKCNSTSPFHLFAHSRAEDLMLRHRNDRFGAVYFETYAFFLCTHQDVLDSLQHLHTEDMCLCNAFL